ncbi:MAG: TonB-dependent siderophore receptor [Acinetobacter sp.]
MHPNQLQNYTNYTPVWYKKFRSFGLLSGLILPFQLTLAAESVQQQLDSSQNESVDAITLATITVWGSNTTESSTAYIPKKTTIASKLPVTVKEIPQSVSVVTRQRIEDQNLTSLDDALRTVTGLTVIPNDSTQSQFRSRGYSLNTTIDGIPSYNGLSGSEQFDLAIYDRVEVLRGAAGLLSGSGDPGGTVNVVTKKPLSKFAVNGVVSGGSWNNYRTEIDVTGPLNTDKTLRGRFVGIAQDRDFFYDKTHQRKFVGYGVLEYDLTDNTTLSATHSIQSNDTDANYSGLPANSTTGELLKNISRTTNPSPAWTTNKSKTNESVLALEHRFDNGWTATAKARYVTRDYDYKDTFASSGLNTETSTLTYARDRDYSYEYERKAVDLYLGGPVHLFNREHNFLIGYNYDLYNVQYTGARGTSTHTNVNIYNVDIAEPYLTHTLGAENTTTQSGFYGQARIKLLDPLTLVLGGRLSDYEYKSRSIAPSTPTAWSKGESVSSEFTPYAGIVYDINKQISVYGSYSDIFIPQDYEAADGSYLKPRQGQQFEIGAKGSFFNDKLNVSIATFLLQDVNRPMTDPNNEDYYIASGEVESKGWEFEISGSPLPNWNLSLGYTHATNKYTKDDVGYEGLPYSNGEPEDSLKIWSHYSIKKGKLSGLKFGIGLNAVSEYSSIFSTEKVRTQGGYTLLGASASYEINKNITVALNAENLTDKKYYARTGLLNTYNVYGTPRNATLSFRFKY